jgi:hypothetical protein
MGDHGGDAVDCSGDSVDSGADAMTFDMQKMREIAENCNSKDESVDHDYWNAHAGMVLQSALDEIERLRDRAQQLLLDVDRNYRGKKEYAAALDAAESLIRKNAETIDEQAKQIAALKSICIEKQYDLMPSAPGCYNDVRRQAAIEQLAQEYPEIFAEEME